VAGHGKQVFHGTGELQGNHCCALSLGYIWSALNGASYNQHKLRKSTAIFPMNSVTITITAPRVIIGLI